MRGWRELAYGAVDDALIRVALMVASLAGVVFGFYYYHDQLFASPLWMWPFIPDSPIAVFLYALALALISIKRRSNKLDSVAFVLMTKIGIWTTAVLLLDFDYYFTPETLALRCFILITHILMVPMAMLLLPGMKTEKVWFFGLLLAVLLIIDWIDYGLGTHPWMPDKYMAGIAALTFSLSLSLSAFLASWQIRENRCPQGPPR
jgi:uncharacterized membrane protein YpjA